MKRLALATFLAAMVAATPALATAAPATTDSAPHATTQQIKEADQIAVQGLNAMRNIQLARLALFQGHPDKAEALTKNASALLADDSVDWDKFVRSDKKTNLIDDKYVAIDASMGISEDYVASPEKQEAIKRANQKMAKGDKKGAVEELRLAGIGVMENVCLMPLNQTRNAVTKAQKLMAEHQYYEANQALKGAEEGVIMDSSAIFAN
ncbi:YfdX family protein [Klebsiella variicola]|uniref:YfdX family protein n=1 Tax=Klebsiella variicola TaxID=244366 RepID=UPI0009BC07BB|nr:YfdX family protein [Klebsiella variicola]MEC6197816.1 YfdX family protein [Klebsiella variicola]SLZ39816.1 YfdX like protein [Klebsiella variicola]HCQ8411080.1 YfdX family protein [Klebsiella variicola]